MTPLVTPTAASVLAVAPGLTDTYLEGVRPEWSVHVKLE